MNKIKKHFLKIYDIQHISDNGIDGAIALFQRSENNRNVIYGIYIGDGDSKAYSSIKSSMLYGPLICTNKEEFWAHITKRMGTVLRTIIKNYITKVCLVCQYLKKWTIHHLNPRLLKS